MTPRAAPVVSSSSGRSFARVSIALVATAILGSVLMPAQCEDALSASPREFGATWHSDVGTCSLAQHSALRGHATLPSARIEGPWLAHTAATSPPTSVLRTASPDAAVRADSVGQPVQAASVSQGAQAAQAQRPTQGIPGRRLQDIYIVARFHDGYWEWRTDYLQQRDEQRQRTSEIRMQLGVIAAERQKLRAEWLRSLYQENQLTPADEYDPGWGPYWESLLGVSSLGTFGDELRREVDQVAFRWSAGLFGAPLVSTDVTGPQLEASYQQERDRLRNSINDWKEQQRRLIDEALQLNRGLAASCAAQKVRSGDRRAWLNAESQRLDDELKVIRLHLYDAAQWYLPDELPALIAAFDPDNTATEEVAALLRAKARLATAAWTDEKIWLQMTSPRQSPPDPRAVAEARKPRLEAIVDLRRVLDLNPANADARGMLVHAELWWLREIASKLDVERRASLDAFREYLSNRGFYPDQPAGWTQDLIEYATALWGLGPIALSAGLPGLDVAGARATELDVTQTTAARHQVSLMAIMRLVKNGVTLREIPALTPDQLRTRITLHTGDGRTLPPDRATRLVQDIRDTLADLEDLKRLASPDPEYLVEDVTSALGRAYFAPLDPTYKFYESVGDLLNIHNIAFLWGPGAIGKMGGKWAGAGYLSDEAIMAAEQAGTLMTGRQAFLSLTRLDGLAKTVASTSIGARLARAAAVDRAARATLGAVDTVTDLGFRLGSAMVLYTGATYLAQDAGIPGAAVLVELLGEIGPSELLADVMRRSGASLNAMATRLDDALKLLERQRDELANSRKLLDEIAGLTDEMGDAGADAARRAVIQQRAGEILKHMEGRAKGRTGASVAEPVDEAGRAAAEALRKGDVAEAGPAVTGGRKAAKESGDQLNEALERLAAARQKLNAAAAAVPAAAPPPRPATAAKTVNELMAEGPPDKFWRPDLYAATGPGRSLQLGDEAIRAGELDAAAAHFRSANKLAAADPAAYQDQLAHASSRLALVVNAQRTGDDLLWLRQSIPASGATRAIDDQTLTQALDNLDASRTAGTAERMGSANPVYVSHDAAGQRYFVKTIVPEPGNALTENLTPAEIENILSTEAASASLANAVGLKAAAARYDPQRRVLVSRAVPASGPVAGTLSSKPEHVALALRKEYAKQRLFRAWIGDSDGHLGNMILGDDGQLYLIDFDLAALSGTTSRQIIGSAGQSEGELLGSTVYTWAFVSRADSNRAMYRWMARLDQTISYADVRETVEAIQSLAARPGELRRILTEAGYRDVEGAVKSLTERAGLLEDVLKPLFDGGLLRMGVAMRLFPEAWYLAGPIDDRRWHRPQDEPRPVGNARGRESLGRAA